jgi:hypothetical protein
MNFSGWGQKRFITWLIKNYPPAPKTALVEVSLAVKETGLTFHCTMAERYEICIAELAWELATFKHLEYQEHFTLIIRPARRRKEKQMWVEFDKPLR